MNKAAASPIRVLVADDHDMMREAVSGFLTGEGFVVAGMAKSGREAIRLAVALHPAVVLMDISMRDMDGIEATSALLKAAPHCRVVGFSLRDDPHTVALMLKAGAAAHVSKAAPETELAATIRRVGGNIA